MIKKLVNWMIKKLINWMIEKLINWMIKELIIWMIKQLVIWVIKGLSGVMIEESIVLGVNQSLFDKDIDYEVLKN